MKLNKESLKLNKETIFKNKKLLDFLDKHLDTLNLFNTILTTCIFLLATFLLTAKTGYSVAGIQINENKAVTNSGATFASISLILYLINFFLINYHFFNKHNFFKKPKETAIEEKQEDKKEKKKEDKKDDKKVSLDEIILLTSYSFIILVGIIIGAVAHEFVYIVEIFLILFTIYLYLKNQKINIKKCFGAKK